jgi:hypothetical protein
MQQPLIEAAQATENRERPILEVVVTKDLDQADVFRCATSRNLVMRKMLESVPQMFLYGGPGDPQL